MLLLIIHWLSPQTPLSHGLDSASPHSSYKFKVGVPWYKLCHDAWRDHGLFSFSLNSGSFLENVFEIHGFLSHDMRNMLLHKTLMEDSATVTFFSPPFNVLLVPFSLAPLLKSLLSIASHASGHVCHQYIVAPFCLINKYCCSVYYAENQLLCIHRIIWCKKYHVKLRKL